MSPIAREEGRRLFGADPAGYDAARPGHPDRVYDVLVERCGAEPGVRVLEIGPGTGQATRRLLDLGAQVTAVEPNRALADYLITALGAAVTVRNETLEESDLPTQAFDLATASSSFHWIEEDAGLMKIYAALRPGGFVALWWTLFGPGEGWTRSRTRSEEQCTESAPPTGSSSRGARREASMARRPSGSTSRDAALRSRAPDSTGSARS